MYLCCLIWRVEKQNWWPQAGVHLCRWSEGSSCSSCFFFSLLLFGNTACTVPQNKAAPLDSGPLIASASLLGYIFFFFLAVWPGVFLTLQDFCAFFCVTYISLTTVPLCIHRVWDIFFVTYKNARAKKCFDTWVFWLIASFFPGNKKKGKPKALARQLAGMHMDGVDDATRPGDWTGNDAYSLPCFASQGWLATYHQSWEWTSSAAAGCTQCHWQHKNLAPFSVRKISKCLDASILLLQKMRPLHLELGHCRLSI